MQNDLLIVRFISIDFNSSIKAKYTSETYPMIWRDIGTVRCPICQIKRVTIDINRERFVQQLVRLRVIIARGKRNSSFSTRLSVITAFAMTVMRMSGLLPLSAIVLVPLTTTFSQAGV